jgi:nucleolar protein 56
MTGPIVEEVIVAWHGLYRRRGTTILARLPAPLEFDALADQMQVRLEGERTPDEDAERSGTPATCRDRRLGLALPSTPASWTGVEDLGDRALHRRVVLEVAGRRLAAGWDPSVHVDEAVRAVAELDHTLNLFGERLVSWAGRDGPPTGEEPGAASVVRHLRTPDATAPSDLGLPEGDPALKEARAQMAELYERTSEVRKRLEAAIEAAIPRRTPNLSALLGPLLAARILSQAGGLDRLARMPASTIQMLGAERAFFEHLRGRAPPPRHGALFLHPDVQGAPKKIRGRMARALAAKAAIAARLDQSGAALRPSLIEEFHRRSVALRSAGPGKGGAKPRAKAGIKLATSRSSRGPDAPPA